MAAAGRFYLRMLRDYTLPTQMVTSAVLFTTGDSVSQHLVERRAWKDHDGRRSLRFAAYGFLGFAPVANRWHTFLNSINLRTKLATVTTRVAIDMAIFGPFACVWFFSIMGLMEGRSFPEIGDRIQNNFGRVMKISYAVFAPAQFANQFLIPLYARPPFMNCVALGFSVFLAGVNARAHGKQEQMEERENFQAVGMGEE